MKDAKKKQPPVFQIEEVMINRMNVVNGLREIGTARRHRRGEAASNQGRNQARKQSEGMNQAGEKMKRDCSLSRLEHGRSERHHVGKWKSL
jgi:hypothetical protein